MHDNRQAISLYEKLGFSRVPVFCVKTRNSFNEPLFVGQEQDFRLNPYAQIITRAARRRGISVEIVNSQYGYFNLHFGGRSICCRESLTELTSAIAMSRCADKRVTRHLLTRVGVSMPEQVEANSEQTNREFLERHGRVVVKPAQGEQGHGVSVDIDNEPDLNRAIQGAMQVASEIIIEQMVQGHDLRIVVIDFRVVAAAIRKPPEVVGNGHHTVLELIEKQSRRRRAATGGESAIPLDSETERCIKEAGHELTEKLPAGEVVVVRKAANVHTGGTIHDVTDSLHPKLIEVAKRSAEVLDLPVVGLDLIVPSVHKPDYWVIEANERPGLANHEPQPTAERFIDLLFPQTVSQT
jgi:GNAT-family acetyltransferase (TIGR03103 family)